MVAVQWQSSSRIEGETLQRIFSLVFELLLHNRCRILETHASRNLVRMHSPSKILVWDLHASNSFWVNGSFSPVRCGAKTQGARYLRTDSTGLTACRVNYIAGVPYATSGSGGRPDGC